MITSVSQKVSSVRREKQIYLSEYTIKFLLPAIYYTIKIVYIMGCTRVKIEILSYEKMKIIFGAICKYVCLKASLFTTSLLE